MNSIQTYAINLRKRIDRRNHIIEQFEGRSEFHLNIVEANEHANGAIGLWNTIYSIIRGLTLSNEKFIILCEDDHQFTEFYKVDVLLDSIFEGQQKGADILLGGVSWFNTALQISRNLFWVDKFSGLQFTVIYRKFFEKILGQSFEDFEAADLKIANLTDNKIVIYPFISIQKEFGYSDVTIQNNEKNHVNRLFETTFEKLGQLNNVALFYELGFAKKKYERDN